MGLNAILTTDHTNSNNMNDIIERRYYSDSLWLNDLIQNSSVDEIFIQSQIGRQKYEALKSLNSQVCILEVQRVNSEDKTMSNSVQMYTDVFIRSIFEQYAFQTYITFHNNQFIIITFHLSAYQHQKERTLIKEKLQIIFERINKFFNKNESREFTLYMGVSSSNRGFKNIHTCYEEATKAIFLKFFYQSPIIFYENIGAFQILLNLQEQGMLESFVTNHIGPLIEEDQKKKSDLLRTLKIYLENNGSKQSAADQLHIVRQSLYYRLKKIKELLGDDYMSTQRRLALQLAIQAYELLSYEAS